MKSLREKAKMRPVRGTSPLTKEKGVWVFHMGEPLSASTTDTVLKQIREERDKRNVGGRR
jgi:hypothetical protein